MVPMEQEGQQGCKALGTRSNPITWLFFLWLQRFRITRIVIFYSYPNYYFPVFLVDASSIKKLTLACILVLFYQNFQGHNELSFFP